MMSLIFWTGLSFISGRSFAYTQQQVAQRRSRRLLRSFAVVMSDMRMPGMNGAELLAQVRERSPESTRMLLTGQADLTSAVAAINDGQIFRFLTKPCAPKHLRVAFEAAAEQHRLLISEQQLLEETLHGSIRALVEVLGVTQPLAFGRASRLEAYVSQMCTALGRTPAWPVEVAALVVQLGTIVLSEETAEKVYYGHALEEHEQERVRECPNTVQRLLGSIPRLEPVLEILEAMSIRPRKLDASIRQGVGILRLAMAFDVLVVQGLDEADALATLRSRREHDEALIDALASQRDAESEHEVREVPLGAVREGMVFVDDVRTEAGTLLVPRGFEVTKGFVARVRGYPRGFVPDLVRVSV